MSSTNRVDEVAIKYQSAAGIEKFTGMLFWIIALLSLATLEHARLPISVSRYLQLDYVNVAFVLSTITYFLLSLFSTHVLLWNAERARRKQFLTDALGVPLTQDRTIEYYNNTLIPSIARIGANTMENAFFSKSIAERMLVRVRIVTGAYILVWLALMVSRGTSLQWIIVVSHVVFSGQLIARWLTLEALRVRHQSTYEQLHDYFRHKVGAENNTGVATIIDSFAGYESTKAATGVLLSSKVFGELNEKLSADWTKVREDLEISEDIEQD